MKNTLDVISMSIKLQPDSPLAEKAVQVDLEAFSRCKRHEISIFGVNYLMTMIQVNRKGKAVLGSDAAIIKDNREIESIDIELVEAC